MRIGLIILAIIGAAYFSRAQGEDPCAPCEKVLQKDISLNISTYQQQVAFLRSVNKERYEVMKRASSAGVSIPIPGFKIDLTSNYEEFNLKRNRYFETNQFKMDTQQAEFVLRETLPEGAYDKWQACIERCMAARYGGAHVWIEMATRDFVDIGILFNSTSYRISTARDVEMEVSGGKLKTSMPRKLEHMKYYVLRVFRNTPGSEVTIRVSSSDFQPKSLKSSWIDRLGIAELTYENWTEKKVRTVHDTKRTPNRDEQSPEDGEPRSPEGNFRAAITSLRVNARAGRYLKNARLTKSGPGSDHSRRETLGVAEGGSMAFATVRNWSHSFRVRLYADEYEKVFHPAPPQPIYILSGKPFLIEIPYGVKNPGLRVKIGENEYFVIPGQSYAEIRNTGKHETPSSIIYTYEVTMKN